ncbi:hypothetical protein [Bacillus paramycoides]|uniref:hypothetical protein n=1 Tax=Bacillus paramycoides TaxID=2026194 RepID=UPI002E1D9AF2|nr:hypothetical protein [Bacillus paramycoides]MED0988281.1 hypothetical protein [Bacillus paramycoides]MED1092200.1 hypothetical protein [Bacillus paramycoides]MED1107547.1 hypothetical protein [Bacillus paramycoides]
MESDPVLKTAEPAALVNTVDRSVSAGANDKLCSKKSLFKDNITRTGNPAVKGHAMKL